MSFGIGSASTSKFYHFELYTPIDIISSWTYHRWPGWYNTQTHTLTQLILTIHSSTNMSQRVGWPSVC